MTKSLSPVTIDDGHHGVVEEYLEYIGINPNNVCWQTFDGEVTIRVFDGK